MTQAERDWTISQIGTDYRIADVDLDMIPDETEYDDPHGHVADWIETVVGDRLLDPDTYGDELYVEYGNRLRIYQPYGPARAYCRIHLTTGD